MPGPSQQWEELSVRGPEEILIVQRGLPVKLRGKKCYPQVLVTTVEGKRQCLRITVENQEELLVVAGDAQGTWAVRASEHLSLHVAKAP